MATLKWNRTNVAYKNGKLYIPEQDQKEYRTYDADRVYVVDTNVRAWVMSDGMDNNVKFRGCDLRRISLSSIVSGEKGWEKLNKGEKLNPYTLWLDAVGRKNIKMAMKVEDYNESKWWSYTHKQKRNVQLSRMMFLRCLIMSDSFKLLANRNMFLAMRVSEMVGGEKKNKRGKLNKLLKMSDKALVTDMVYSNDVANWIVKASKKLVGVNVSAGGRVLRAMAYISNENLKKHLFHANKINENLVDFIRDLDQANLPQKVQFAPSFWTELSNKGHLKSKKGHYHQKYSGLSQLLNDTLHQLTLIERRGLKYDLKVVKAPWELSSLHDAVSDFYKMQKYDSSAFPAPPVKGNAIVRPLTSVAELFNEGREMHNCVGSYADYVYEGRSFIYAAKYVDRDGVTHRATIEMQQNMGEWMIKQCLGECNQRLKSEAFKALIEAWVHDELDVGKANRDLSVKCISQGHFYAY